jgi:hypothetical protein
LRTLSNDVTCSQRQRRHINNNRRRWDEGLFDPQPVFNGRKLEGKSMEQSGIRMRRWVYELARGVPRLTQHATLSGCTWQGSRGKCLKIRFTQVFLVLLGMAGTWGFDESIADPVASYVGQYRVDAVAPARNGLSDVQLTVTIRNVSGAALGRGVLELDSLPPAPRAQSFLTPLSLANGAAATMAGRFTVSSVDARRWQHSSGVPAPNLVVVGPDGTGRMTRKGVSIQPQVTGQ